MAVDREWIRSEPKVLRVNIQALINGIEESISNIIENHDELQKLAPEFFKSAYMSEAMIPFRDYRSELYSMWLHHKNNPLVK